MTKAKVTLTEEKLDLIEQQLKRHFPNGDPAFVEITMTELELHDRKNADYARGGDPLGNFVREAAIFSLYPKLDLSKPIVVAMVLAMKQIDAAMWMLSEDYNGDVEGLDERLADIHVYTKLARVIHARGL